MVLLVPKKKLTHFLPMFHFYNAGFLTFSGGIGMEIVNNPRPKSLNETICAYMKISIYMMRFKDNIDILRISETWFLKYSFNFMVTLNLIEVEMVMVWFYLSLRICSLNVPQIFSNIRSYKRESWRYCILRSKDYNTIVVGKFNA